MEERVVVTGIGMVSPKYIGSNAEELFDSLIMSEKKEKKEVIENISEKLEEFISYNLLRRMCRFSQLALYPNLICKKDSGIDIDGENEIIGSVMNTSYGPLDVTERLLNTLIKDGPAAVSPMDFSNTVNNCATGQVSITMQLKGVSTTLIGSSGVVYAYDLIRHGKAPCIFVSGVEEFNEHVKEVAKENKCGVSEGSCCILLESLSHAQNRRAKIYSEITACESFYVNDVNADRIYKKKLAGYAGRKIVYENSSILDKVINTLVDNRNGRYLDMEKCTGHSFGATEVNNCLVAAAMIKEGRYITNNDNPESSDMTEDKSVIAVSIQQGNCCSIVELNEFRN